MTTVAPPDALAVDWLSDLALLSAQEECGQARCAWAQVAPADGVLVSGATPRVAFANGSVSLTIATIVDHEVIAIDL